MRLFLDTTPLRASHDFRRLWIGQAVSFFGSTITTAALPYQVFHETGSSFAVGLLGAVQLGPLLLFALVGGAFADSIDKRRLLLGVTATAIGVLGRARDQRVARSSAGLAAVRARARRRARRFAVNFPVLRSLLPMLARRGAAPGGVSRCSRRTASFGMMAGPALGGVLIGVRRARERLRGRRRAPTRSRSSSSPASLRLRRSPAAGSVDVVGAARACGSCAATR